VVHVVPHITCGAAHTVVHVPDVQICPPEQRVPHAPQLFTSFDTVVQRPLQSV
jgi:hypothetical protein